MAGSTTTASTNRSQSETKPKGYCDRQYGPDASGDVGDVSIRDKAERLLRPPLPSHVSLILYKVSIRDKAERLLRPLGTHPATGPMLGRVSIRDKAERLLRLPLSAIYGRVVDHVSIRDKAERLLRLSGAEAFYINGSHGLNQRQSRKAIATGMRNPSWRKVTVCLNQRQSRKVLATACFVSWRGGLFF